MADKTWHDRAFGTIDNAGKVRAVDFAGSEEYFAPVIATIPYNSSEAELFTAANPGVVKDEEYATIATGELQGSATALQMPSVECSKVNFKARDDNAGYVYIGGSGVTIPDGTTDTTTGFELDAGEETGWLPCSNLSIFHRICNNAGDDLVYIALT